MWAIQRSKNAWSWVGPSRSHLLQPIRVVAGGEPACQLAEPDAALAGLLLGHSWPLTHTLAGQGK